MSVPVGITVPKLLPITGSFAPFFASYYALLTLRVISNRVEQKKFIGTSDSPTDPLSIASRSHANFTENVPLALLLGAVVEVNGGNRKVLTAGLGALLAFRIVHVEFGLRGKDALQWGRLTGVIGTQGFLLGAAGYAAYLVKGYWGY